MNVLEPLARFARLRPNHPAIIRADGGSISYARLDSLLDAACHRFRAARIIPGDVVALDPAGPDEAVGIVAILALARYGATSAAASIADAQCDHRFGTAALPLDASWLQAAAGPAWQTHPGGDTLLRIFASSGTTGMPKHIPVSHNQYRTRMEGYFFALSPAPATRVIAVGLGITWGFSALIRTLWAGGTIVLSNPARFAAAAATHRVTCLTVSPVSLAAILAALPTGLHLPELAMIEISGAALPPALATAARGLCPQIHTMIGAAETGGVAAAAIDAPDMQQPGAAGILLPFIEARTADEHGDPLPDGTEGTLQYRGPGLAQRYLDAQFPSDPEGWFTTTDHGIIRPGGLLCLLGRTADVINTGGVKTAPGPIEAVINRYPGITDCAVFPAPDANGIDQIWAAVTSPTLLDLASLSAACATLGAFRPVAFLQPHTLPRNANGKVLTRELRALAIARRR